MALYCLKVLYVVLKVSCNMRDSIFKHNRIANSEIILAACFHVTFEILKGIDLKDFY